MSDILPKVKLYILISIFQFLINIGINIFSSIEGMAFSFEGLIGDVVGAFLPFVSFIGFINVEMPALVILISGIFTGIFTGVQTFLIVMMGFQLISNLIWHPDV